VKDLILKDTGRGEGKLRQRSDLRESMKRKQEAVASEYQKEGSITGKGELLQKIGASSPASGKSCYVPRLVLEENGKSGRALESMGEWRSLTGGNIAHWLTRKLSSSGGKKEKDAIPPLKEEGRINALLLGLGGILQKRPNRTASRLDNWQDLAAMERKGS